MKKLCLGVRIAFFLLFGCISCSEVQQKIPERITLSKETLMDKIKGGWGGQTIGCTYGGPTEFRYSGTMIQDYVPIEWNDGYIEEWYNNSPGLYDDVYMDLTFVDVFDRLGLDAPVDSFAVAFATAKYPLWHANQAARYNILAGIMPPRSGHWLNNPHADDIDYQIEADYSGLMSPGMPNAASEISDKIGHIMNYGNGWYGGVYVGAMYSVAFVSDDMEFIVAEALKAIPSESTFYQCIDDVIGWHKEYPGDWKQTWFECQKKWSEDMGCPEGVFNAFNIDALINSAYIVIGLLYGEKDFYKTMDIATRCGLDSDCNPASAAGILGTVIGYSNIPSYWITALKKVENRDLAYTGISLNKAYQMSFNQALQMIERNGGSVDEKQVTVVCQNPIPVRYEKSFEGHYPVRKFDVGKNLTDTVSIPFEGIGIVLRGEVKGDENYVGEVEIYIDDELYETVQLPASFIRRRYELFWKYQLPKGRHTVRLKWLNPQENSTVRIWDALVYSDIPEKKEHPSIK